MYINFKIIHMDTNKTNKKAQCGGIGLSDSNRWV